MMVAGVQNPECKLYILEYKPHLDFDELHHPMDLSTGISHWQVWVSSNLETLMERLTGWWFGHPSEKYESQLGWLATQYMGK